MLNWGTRWAMGPHEQCASKKDQDTLVEQSVTLFSVANQIRIGESGDYYQVVI